MSDGIYITRDNIRQGDRNAKTFVELRAQDYESEDLLQSLLADCPHLLAGAQMNPVSPRRWILVDREVGIRADANESERFAVDHIFLDQDGIPTFIEVKRKTDARSRREVVGQMLDYVSNAVMLGLDPTLRVRFEGRQRKSDEPKPADEIRALIGKDRESDDFWGQAETNLRAGRVRLVFVADEIRPELRTDRRVPQPADETGRRARDRGPAVCGRGNHCVGTQPARSDDAKAAARTRLDEASFLEHLRRRHQDDHPIAKQIFEWARGTPGVHLRWGEGAQYASCHLMVDGGGDLQNVASLWSGGTLAINFGYLKECVPFVSEVKRREFCDRLNAIPGIHIAADAVDRFPGIRLTVLRTQPVLERLLEVLSWAGGEIGNAQ